MVLSADISGASRRMGKENENLVYASPWDFKKSLTCCKILQHGTSSFTSHPKKGVLCIFITLKIPPPWPAKNPRPLGSVASTLTLHHQDKWQWNLQWPTLYSCLLESTHTYAQHQLSYELQPVTQSSCYGKRTLHKCLKHSHVSQM
jgi:hypothetical protein